MDGVPKASPPTGGGGPAIVPNLRVCKHLFLLVWHTQERKGDKTSCRDTVLSAWQVPPVGRTDRRAGLPQKGKCRHVVRRRQSSSLLESAPR